MRGDRKKTVWVTRTEPANGKLARELLAAGVDVLADPLLAIAGTGAPMPLAQPDFAIFVSVHAVTHAFASGSWRPSVAFAVGQSTASALADYDIKALTPTRATSEGVIELLDSSASAKGSGLLVAGVDGREVIADWLDAHCERWGKWEVYRREPRDVVVERGIDAIEAASGDAIAQIAQHAGRGVFFDAETAVFVPSQRVAAIARKLGFTNVIVGDGAASSDVVATMVAAGLVPT